MRNYIVDVECTDIESKAAILSVAIIEFGLDDVPVWEDLIKKAFFVKLDVTEQVKNFNRTVDRKTMEWWAKQCQMVKDRSLTPKDTDLDPASALDLIRDYCGLNKDSGKNRDVSFWARGILDQATLDSLSNAVCGDILIPYNRWYDIRTAIDLLFDDSYQGYVKVPGFSKDTVLKHDPIHDCAFDLMMLLSKNISDEQPK